jgi:uncharacterized protein (TIGR03032 family)
VAELAPPIFIVGAPRAGDDLLRTALAQASGVWHAAGRRPTFLEAVPAMDTLTRRRTTHRLTAADAADLADEAQGALRASLLNREGRGVDAATGTVIPIADGTRLAQREPLLDAAFPGARFVFVARDPREAVAEMLILWRQGSAISIDELPGWDGPWSLPLVPDWRSLAGLELEEVVAEQWRMITELLLDDLEAVDDDRWIATDRATLLADPRSEVRRLCAFADIPYDQALLTPLENTNRRLGGRKPEVPPELAAALPRTDRAAARMRQVVEPVDAPPPPRPASAYGSGHTTSFPERLRDFGGSLLVSTYQTNKLVVAREREGRLNTHFRAFEKPMGMAVDGGRLWLGTRTEVWDLRDLPEVAPKLDPPGSHDACFLPRNRHTTGDIAIHEMGVAGGELWIVNTAFSCLATLDADHSFVPRWKPPFVSKLAPGDRCHLNGMAVIDDRVKYVTALGTTDEPGTWRENKATGGVLMDVPSSEIVVSGLSMPHSPHWHDGRLWVLESGKGELCVVDLERGTTETVVELPGFTRGLAIAGRTAFVGLSQIRESSTFGDLPLTKRLEERVSGVWMVDIDSGRIEGFLRFDDLVQEVFDVALLPGRRYPEIAQPGSSAVATSYVLP